MVDKLVHFNTPSSFAANFQETERGLVKKALILAEGSWTDSKKRRHSFPIERIFKIAENTNAAFEAGTRIPLLQDHRKEQDSTIGDLNSAVEVRAITPDDVQGRNTHLIGKMGIFASEVLIKASKAIQQAKEGLLSTISPGIDILSDTIREISTTPQPAIAGMTLFSQGGAGMQGLSWDELQSSDVEFAQLKEQYDELTDKFFQLNVNIMMASEDELGGRSPQDLQQEAMEGFMYQVTELFGMEEELSPEEQMMQQGQQGYNPQNQQPPLANYYSSDIPVIFTMRQMANFQQNYSEEDLAEFGFRKALSPLIRQLRGNYQVGQRSLGLGGALRKTGKRLWNAARGKLSSGYRGSKRVFGESTPARLSTAGRTVAPKVVAGVKVPKVRLSQGQVERQQRVVNKKGRMTRKAYIPASPWYLP